MKRQLLKLIGGNAKQAKELINLFKNANVGTRFDNTQCTAEVRAQYMLALYPNINPSVFNHLGHGGDW